MSLLNHECRAANRPASRRLADAPLAVLGLLSLFFVAALAAFVARQTLPYDPFVACETLLTTLLARLTSLGLLLPLTLLGATLLAGGLALVHQLWATQRMLAGLRPRRAAVLPPSLADSAARAGLGGRIDLIRADEAFVFCHGYLRPRVAISSGMFALLEPEELEAVLRHERHHLSHRDPLKILMSRSLASALFFLPLAGALRNAYLAGKEICADLEAMREASAGANALASAVFKTLEAERPDWPAGVLAVGSLSPMQARIERLIEPRGPRPRWASVTEWLSSAALAALIFGFGQGSVVASRSAPIESACRSHAVLAPPAGASVEARSESEAAADRDAMNDSGTMTDRSLDTNDSETMTDRIPDTSCASTCALLECHQPSAPR